MKVVTGGFGFIGSHLAQHLAELGEKVLIIDDLSDGRKFSNLGADYIYDYADISETTEILTKYKREITTVFHQGANSKTTDWNGKEMLRNNYMYSKLYFEFCQNYKIPMVYASSASVYGMGELGFKENIKCLKPLNVYGYSKLLFDNYVNKQELRAPVIGLRYFNVYGKNERHKGEMASVFHHFSKQVHETNTLKLFGNYDGYAAGEQKRDFIHVDDVVAINLYCQNLDIRRSGVYNAGTGQPRSFNQIANSVIEYLGKGEITYIPFPEHLVGSYQSYTCANIDKLFSIGFSHDFINIAKGINQTLS